LNTKLDDMSTRLDRQAGLLTQVGQIIAFRGLSFGKSAAR
jgi:hypothetical protein